MAAYTLATLGKRSPPRSARTPLTQAVVSRYEARQEEQTSPHSSVQQWLDRVPQGVGLAPSRASSRHPSVMTSVVQATLPLGAEAAAVVSQPMYMPSRASQQSRRSRGSCPIEVVEGLMQITQQQRVDAIQRENLQVQREVDMVQELSLIHI